MKVSKYKYIFLLFLIFTILVGCSNSTNENTTNNSDSTKNDNSVVGNGDIKVINCTREAQAKDGIDAKFNYEITYQGEYIKKLHSIEKVISENSSSLDEYENAYKNIKNRYSGLKYYDTNIIRTDNSVTNDVTINYEKIDTDKLLEIEGSEDNVIENGKVKLSTWISFAKRLGVTCDE